MIENIINTEKWKPVIYVSINGIKYDYSDKYEISNTGIVRNKKTKKNLKVYIKNTKRVIVCLNGKLCLVHRLVAFGFPEICGEWFEGAEVNHKDENPLNNNANNLEWCSKLYNMRYGTGIQRRAVARLNNDSKIKIICQYDLEGNFIKEWPSSMEIQRKLDFYHSSIIRCCNNKEHFNTAYGFKWKFKKENL